mgnify:CR=1 FL=1
MTKKEIKGGNEKMDKIQRTVYRDFCQYCNREFVSLNERQIEQIKASHEMYCKKNPSIKENEKLN